MKKTTRKIREEIWELLLSKGYTISSHSTVILKKDDVPYERQDGAISPRQVKYKFGKNNLQKFVDGVKRVSIPFVHLTIVNGKIIQKEE